MGLLIFSCLSQAQRSSKSHAALLRGPYLQVATSTSIVIRWRTDVLERGYVYYGTDPGMLNRSVQDTILTSEHKIRLQGLTPHTKYYYAIGSWKDTLPATANNYFYTLPIPGEEGTYRIAALGDCGNNSINQRNVRDQLVHYLGNNYLDAWILLGDNSYSSGRDAEFQSNFFNIYKDDLLPKYPLFPSPGNHDYYDGDSAEGKVQVTHQIAYFQNFSMPIDGEAGGAASHNPAFYSFDIGNIHFLSLDSYGIEEGRYQLCDTAGPQVEWVKKDMEANQNKGWIIAYWHHPPYTMGSHNSDKSADLVKIRENFIRILERYGVDLVLCGHSHDYERSRLMKDHFGPQDSFDPKLNLVNVSSGFYDGTPNSCPYIKDSATGYKGTLYVVSGSAGQLGGNQSAYPHKALPYSDYTHGGSGLLEVQGNRLDWKWINADGRIRDHFTMMKNAGRRSVLTLKKGESTTLRASFVGDYQWSDGKTAREITVSPSSTTTYIVKDKFNCIKDIFEVKVVNP